MFFNKNLRINNLLVFGITICTVCASSNAMDNHRNLRPCNRSNNTYSNLSNNINNINGKDKYKTSYIILNRDKHDIKVPTYSINKVSNRNYFTIKAQKDNTHEILLNTRDTNKKVNDIHNYLFTDGGTKRIDGTYDNSKKLVKGQYELKHEVKKNNKDIEKFNKDMHNNLVNLESHISKLIRNNQNNNNELNKNISNNFLENKQILYNNINQQQENRNELTNIINDNFLKTNKNIHDSSLQQQKDSHAIIENTKNQTQMIINDANQKMQNVGEKTIETMKQLDNRHEEDFKEYFAREGEMIEQFNKEHRDMFNQLDDIRKTEKETLDNHIHDYKHIREETIKLLEKTNDAILKNVQDSNEQKNVNQHIKNIQQMLHIVNNNYVQSNVNNKLGEFLLEKAKLKAIQQQNSIIQQQMYNYNNNIINQNLQYYNPNISTYNNQINYNLPNNYNPNINNQMNNNINIRVNRNINDEVQFVNGEIIKNDEIVSNDNNVQEKTSIYDYAKNINENSMENKIINNDIMPEPEDVFHGKNPYDSSSLDINEIRNDLQDNNEYALKKLNESADNIKYKNNNTDDIKVENEKLSNSINNIKENTEKELLMNKIEEELKEINNNSYIKSNDIIYDNIEQSNNADNVMHLAHELNQD